MGRFPFFFTIFSPFRFFFVLQPKRLAGWLSNSVSVLLSTVFVNHFRQCKQDSCSLSRVQSECTAAHTLLCIEINWFITLLSRKVHTNYKNDKKATAHREMSKRQNIGGKYYSFLIEILFEYKLRKSMQDSVRRACALSHIHIYTHTLTGSLSDNGWSRWTLEHERKKYFD